MSDKLLSNEIQRYSRHFTLPDVGTEGQRRLKGAKVLCVGVGGLGSPLLQYLAAAGVGTLGLVDDDVVEISNLQRQVLFGDSDLGQKKVDAAEKRLKDINPYINIIKHAVRLTHDNALDIIKGYDIVADGTDNYGTRYVVNDACFHLNKPNVYASIFQFEGQCTVFTQDGGPCYRCLYPAAPPAALMPNCAEAGVFGVLPGVMGSIQGTEVIKLILGMGASLKGRLLIFDALNMSFRELAIAKDKDCLLCIHDTPFEQLNHESISCEIQTEDDMVPQITAVQLKEKIDNKDDILLLDVRKPLEYEICHLNAVLIPIDELATRMDELDKEKEIVVYCKLGLRGEKATKLLRKNGFSNVSNLKGGIIEWIKDVDNSMTSY